MSGRQQNVLEVEEESNVSNKEQCDGDLRGLEVSDKLQNNLEVEVPAFVFHNSLECEERTVPEERQSDPSLGGSNISRRRKSEMSGKEQSISSNKEKKLKCPYPDCIAAFKRKSRLEDHLRVHEGVPNFRCGEKGCRKAYYSKMSLLRHVRLSHGNPIRRTHRCALAGCMKEFTLRTSMKRHMRVVHRKIYPFTCDFCHKGFRNLNQLKTHEFQHTQINLFRCDFCNLGFTSRSQISRHMREHKKHTCKECGLDFTSYSLLRKHCAQEHPINYKCDTCGKEFHNRAWLEQHVVVHLDFMTREMFFCPYEGCDRLYYAKRNLSYHIHAFHERQKAKVKCDICGKELYNKNKLQAHISTIHMKPQTCKKKERRKGKDAEVPKIPLVTKLTGIEVLPRMSPLILNQDTVTLDFNTDHLLNEDSPETTQQKKLNMLETQPFSVPIVPFEQNGRRELRKRIKKENLFNAVILKCEPVFGDESEDVNGESDPLAIPQQSSFSDNSSSFKSENEIPGYIIVKTEPIENFVEYPIS